MPEKRPARTRFEKGLFGYSSGFFRAFSLVCLALAALIGWISWQQLHEPPPELIAIDGVLEDASFDKYGLELKLAGSAARFAVHHAPDFRVLRRLFETQLRPGSELELVVDAAQWHKIRSPASDEEPKVEIRGMALEGVPVLSPDDVARVEAENAASGPYAVAGVFAITLLFAYLAQRRAPLLDALQSATQPTAVDPGQDLLALKPPFELHPQFGRRERLQIWIILFLVGGFGAGMMIPAYLQWQDARHVARIWESGTSAQGTVVHAVAERNGTRSYKLQISLDDQGSVREVESAYEVWFEEWPVPEQVEVRYLPDAPDQGVSEPAYRARDHTLGTAALFLFFGVAMLGLTLFCVHVVRRKLDDMRELARSGTLMYAEVLKLQQTTGQAPQLEVEYRIPDQEKTRQVFGLDVPPPWLDGDRVVVAASHDRRTSCALRVDGYPLSLTKSQSAHVAETSSDAARVG